MLHDIQQLGKDYAVSAYWFWTASYNLRRGNNDETTVASLNYLLSNVTAYPKIYARVHALKEDYEKRKPA